MRQALAAVLVCLGVAAATARAAADAPPRAVATGGRVVAVSADSGRVAVHLVVTRGGRRCDEIATWQPPSSRLVAAAPPACAAPDGGTSSFDGLTLAGGRLAWTSYAYGNHAYCEGPFATTPGSPKPDDLGACDGVTPDVHYDFAGSGPLLVARRYTQCDADCAPDYSGTYEADVALYRVTTTLVEIGPLERDTRLLDVDAGRLLLGNGSRLEVVVPGRGNAAVFVRLPARFGRAYLSGGDVLVATGATVATYDAATGRPTGSRRLAASAEVVGFAGGIVAYTTRGGVRALRLANGRDAAVATATGVVAAQLDRAGLFYATNGGRGGRLAFVPRTALVRLLGG